MDTNTNNLTPTLNDQQIRENITALQNGGLPNDQVQKYVDNYQKGTDGNYVLKGSQAQSQQTFSDATSTSGSFNQNSKKTFLDKVAGIIPGVKTLEGIGTVIANTGIVGKSPQDMAIESLNQSGDIQKKLADQILSDKAEGKDTARLEKALHALQNDAQAEGSQISNLGTQGETNNQAIGDAVSLASTVAGGAELAGAGGEAATTALEGLKVGAKTGAIGGALAGAGNGAGNAISNDETAGQVIKSTLQGAASGGAGGAVLGGALGAGVGALAKASPTIQATIDAIDANPTGKKLAGAYKDVVNGSRELTPGSVFKEQALSPTQQTINLGNRIANPLKLSDGTVLDAMNLGNNAPKNLTVLKQGLTDTEDALSTALKGDHDINFNAQKPELQTSLQELKTNGPQEFTTNIKDNTNVYNKVVNFAQKLVTDSEDSIQGIRDARTSFDAQARREFPSAFKEGGFIDTKTPAGAAIKSARDAINEHLYDTAPNGSDIKALIGREADIFRATENVAPKAAASHGESLITKVAKTVRKNPVGSAAIGYVGNEKLKKYTGIGL